MRFSARSLVFAALVLFGFGMAWVGYERFRNYPLDNLPALDLSQASPAVIRVIEDARHAVRAAPRSGRAWGELGLYLRAHEFDVQANVCLLQAMKFDPREILWPYLYASSLSVKDRPESERCFRLAASLRPGLALPRLRLAELYLEERRLNEAESEYFSALQVEPENARALLGLGLVALANGDVAAARRWAERSFALDPEQRSTAELLARVYYRQGDKAAAARQQAVLDRMPIEEVGWEDPFSERVLLMRHDPGSMGAAARELIARGRAPEAISVLERLVRAAPETSQWPVLLGQQLIREGRIGEARQVLDVGLTRHPDAADLHFQSGVVHYMVRHWDEAATAFRRAVSLKPDFSDAHYNLGHTLAQSGDARTAMAEFREAIRFRPDYAAAYTNLAKLLLAVGEREAARDALATAERLSPHDAHTVQLLKQAQPPLADEHP